MPTFVGTLTHSGTMNPFSKLQNLKYQRLVRATSHEQLPQMTGSGDVVVKISEVGHTQDATGLKAETGPNHIMSDNGGKLRGVASKSQLQICNGGLDYNGDRQSRANEKGNFWREVSCDYMDDLLEMGSRSEPRPGNKSRKQRPKSFDFDVPLDPPTKLIGDFLERQKASGKLALDMDMEMVSNVSDSHLFCAEDRNMSSLSEVSETNYHMNEEPSSLRSSSTPRTSTPKGFRAVSFETPNPDQQTTPTLTHQPTVGNSSRSASSQDESSDSEEIETLSTPPRIPSLNRAQTRSRLADPPLPLPPESKQEEGIRNRKSTQLKSSQLRSGILTGKTGLLAKVEEEEEDPLKDADIPQKFKKNSWDIISFLEWVAFILIMGWLICSLTVSGLKTIKLWNMYLWKWALLVLLIFCGRLVSTWIIRVVVLSLETNFLLRKRVLYFVYALRKGLRKCLWFGFALLLWRLIFFPKVESTATKRQKIILSYVTKVLNCFFIAAVIWLIKILCVKVLASSFHVSTYFDRIQESLFSQYVLETLSGPPLVELENEESKLREEVKGLRKAGLVVPDLPELLKKKEVKGKASGLMPGRSGLIVGGKSGVIPGKSGLIVGKSGVILAGKSGMIRGGRSGMIGRESERKQAEEAVITVDDLQRLNQKNISAWNMKRLINVVKSRGISTLAHQIDSSANEGEDVEIQSEWQAKAAARNIFKNVAKPGARCISQGDLMRFMPQEQVARAMSLFEGATETGKITKTALKNFVVYVFRERRALALALNDSKTAVKKLHGVLDVVVSVVVIIIWLLVLGIATTHFLLFLSSQLLLMVFIFGNTLKTLFEAIVFVFVMHPYDVGDRCMVDGNQMVVEEMNILSTTFMRYDGEKIWYPNSVLGAKPIFNYYRTPDTGDVFNFSIHVSTPVEKITALKEKIGRYIEGKRSHWTSDYNMMVLEIEDMNRMKMQLQINHTINFHNVQERQIRRSHLVLEVKRYCEELNIEYHALPQDVRIFKCK